MLLHLCFQYHRPDGAIRTSQVATLISIASPTSVTPVRDDLWIFIRFTSNHLLPATLPKVSAHSQYDAFRGLLPFTSFRLVYFAIYASWPLLPGATQDSLHGGADFSFQDGTFTHQISAPYLGARARSSKSSLTSSFRRFV